MGLTFVAELGENLKHLTFEGVVRSNDLNLLGKASDGGSVS